jgi:hypothetical protein
MSCEDDDDMYLNKLKRGVSQDLFSIRFHTDQPKRLKNKNMLMIIRNKLSRGTIINAYLMSNILIQLTTSDSPDKTSNPTLTEDEGPDTFAAPLDSSDSKYKYAHTFRYIFIYVYTVTNVYAHIN